MQNLEKLNKQILRILVIAGTILLLFTFNSIAKSEEITTSIHLILGNPSHAIHDPSNPENYLIEKEQYALSYNDTTKTPNWVSWQLNQLWLGEVPRCHRFHPDLELPKEWDKVTPNDYSHSGFDRGHAIPSGDRRTNTKDNCATFLMTNIIPQTPDNNRGPWEKLENYCRELAQQGKELYIIAGGYGNAGTIADGKINVPEHTWKAIAILDTPGLGIDGVTPSTRVIAVDIPNKQGIRDDDWRKYLTTVDAIETATGYDLFSNVPESIQNLIEAKTDESKDTGDC